MKEKRRNYLPSQKVSIVRELLEGGDSLSKNSEEKVPGGKRRKTDYYYYTD